MPVLQNGVWGMKISGLTGEPITNNSGQYSVSVYQGWSGYINFQKNGWYVVNPSINYNHISSNISELITAGFLVKGLIYRGSGNPIKNVAFNGFPGGTVYSDSNGIYSKLLDSGWTGTVTPTNPGSTFDPANRTYTNLSTSYYYHNYSEIPKQVLNLKVFLSGAYSSGTDTMICKLKRNSFLSQIPNLNYSNKGIKFQYTLKPTDTVTQSFWNQNMKIVDWLAIEIVSTTSFHAVDTELALLRNDGRILNLNGDTLIKLNTSVPVGNYYVIIRHRNHIAIMSSTPISVTNNTPLYDFTTGLNQYYGNDAKLLKPGLYGMYCGDANYDGIVNNSDFTIYDTDSQNAANGYIVSDFNLDGYVTGGDFNILAPMIRRTIATNIPITTSFSIK